MKGPCMESVCSQSRAPLSVWRSFSVMLSIALVFRYSSMQEIVAMPTKNSVSRSSPLPLVVRSVAELNELAYWHDWTRVVLPRPGCGLGGLLWRNVKPIVDELDDRFTVVTFA